MRVGIEGSLFFKPGTGVGHFAKRLIKAASQLDSDLDFEIIRHRLPLQSFQPPLPPNQHLHYRLVRWFPPMVYYQVFKRLNWFIPYDLIALRKYDAVLFLNFIAFPLLKKTKSIIVIHDLSFILFPQFTQAKNLIFITKLMPRSVERADHIITISENSKKEIIKHYGVPVEKISIIPNAVDHEKFYLRPASQIQNVRKIYDLPEKYIHFHGTIEPRKNVQGLLDAYSQLSKDLQAEYGLVLSGGKGWKDEEIQQKITRLKSQGLNIVTTGYVHDDDDLPAIYSGAALFVWPSFYEGFGVPPLEAMACGVPVITSNNSSLPEVVGDAAIKVNAEDNNELAHQMQRILTNKILSKKLREKGYDQAAKFSWENSAKKLIKLLDSL